jgi:hypothetical protein
MRIDFSQPILDLQGKPIKTKEDEVELTLTLERVTVSALLQPSKEETGDEKYKKYGFMKRIHDAKEPVELKTDEISFIKKSIGSSAFTALVVGQAWDLLEGQQAEAKVE